MSLLEDARSADTQFQQVPIIDLSALARSQTDPAARRALVAQVRDACIRVGFFYVSHHGIPEAAIQRVLAAAERYFTLPEATKMERANTLQANFMGYSPLLSGRNNPDGGKDLQEGFEFGFEPRAAGTGARAVEEEKKGSMAGANVWPAEEDAPGFRDAALEYYHAATGLGHHLFPLFAEALDLPSTFFADKTRNSAALMKLLHYPPQPGRETLAHDEIRSLGIGAHTDWECFTMLWQQPGNQALQVLNSSKQWIDAPPIPGTLVINLGDEFTRMTNGIFKSTVHRAVNRSGAERYSIPLFFGIDYDVLLEPIPGCVSPDRPMKYEVITAGDYIKARLHATFNH